ncbi:hypothetical protein ACR42D_04900 [Desulfovibrio caledoniensis]
MRSIDIRHLALPVGWQERANNALEDVRSGVCRPKDRAGVWCDLKDGLAGLSYDKCWYCESRQVRSDDAVDHFRPKGNVKDTEREHPGYWWLAFDKNNYRYSCTFCNSRRKNAETGETEGKGDYFPLRHEESRAYAPGDERVEEPLLLDPCNAGDPSHLDFHSDGTPCCKFPNDPESVQRVEVSIELYHLDHPGTVEERRLLAAHIESWLDEANDAHEEMKTGDRRAAQNYSNRFRDLQTTMRPDAEYSVFARRIIAGYRHYEWVDDLFDTL